jgi:DNA ligase (NAD+)
MRYTGLSESEQRDLYLKCKSAYYDGEPICSDAVFDEFEEYMIQKIGSNDSLFRVGSNDEYEIEHDSPMLSLNKYKEDEIDGVIKWMGGRKIFGNYKMDGCAGSLIYEKGHLVLAKTRGDGVMGKNITKLVKFITLPEVHVYRKIDMEVRGEFVISKINYEKIQVERKLRGLDPFDSLRNCVAGMLNPNKKNNMDLAKFLTFVSYDIITDEINFNNESDKIVSLQKYGFRTPEETAWLVFSKKEHLLENIKYYTKAKDEYEFLTDGIVLSYQKISDQESVGYHKLYPKFKVAYKLISETAETKVLDIEYNVTRTGKLSVVAILEPVKLSGARIKRASLYNPKNIQDNDIAVGDIISIVRSGEIIPKYLQTVKKGSAITCVPHACPVCNTPLRWSTTKTDLYCDNLECEAQVLQKIQHWVDILDIDHISHKTIETLYNNCIIRTISDLYRLNVNHISVLSGFGDKTANLLVKGLKNTKNMEFASFLRGLGIKGIGRTLSKDLAKEFYSIENLCGVTTISRFDNIPNTAEKTKKLLLYAIPFICRKVRELESFITIKTCKTEIQSEVILPLSNLSFIITGSVTHPKKRKGVEADIIENGGTISSSVKDGLSYLVINEQKGSSKEKKAVNLNIKMISEQELYKMIGV